MTLPPRRTQAPLTPDRTSATRLSVLALDTTSAIAAVFFVIIVAIGYFQVPYLRSKFEY